MADRKEFEIGGKPLSALRVVDLKLELEKRGLSKSGSKKELADRLKVQLRLEKLQEHASTDEGHVPNLRLQDDEIAEQNDLIKDYLSKQQQTYEMQKEARRRVELEEQRVRDSSEASAEDTSQGEEEPDSKLTNEAPQEEPAKVPEIQTDVTEQQTDLRQTVEPSTSSQNVEDESHNDKTKEYLAPPIPEALDLTRNTEGESQTVQTFDDQTNIPTLSEVQTDVSGENKEVEQSEPVNLQLTKNDTADASLDENTNVENEQKDDSTKLVQSTHAEGGLRSSPEGGGEVEASNQDVPMKNFSKEGGDGGHRSERGASSSPSRGSFRSESRKQRRSRRHSTSSRSSSSSRSRSTDSQSSDSRNRSHKRNETKRNENYQPETVEDSASQSSLKQELEVKLNAEEDDKMMDVEESSSTVDEVSNRELQTSGKSVEPAVKQEEAAKVSSRKISLSTMKKSSTSEDVKENGESGETQAPRKRKWGNSGASSTAIGKKTSLSISTDSLKGLIPELKPLSTDSLNVVPESSEARSVPVNKPAVAPTTKREIVFNSRSQAPNTKTEKETSEAVEPPSKVSRAVTRRISTSGLSDSNKITPTPARHPPSKIIHIRNLVRPFTLNQLKELLSKTGTLIEGGFWIDKIKSKCYVTYENEDQAVATRQALHGTQWPSSNPKILNVDFATQDELEFHRNLSENAEVKNQPVVGNAKVESEGPVRPRAPSPRSRGLKADDKVVAKPRRNSRSSADRENKEKERVVAVDRDRRGERGRNHQTADVNNDRDKPRADSRRDRDQERSRAKDKNKQPPIREWDREKIGERSPGERDRARVAHNRNRTRSRSRSRGAKSPLNRRDRIRDVENRDRNERRREEEAPAKLLDDLFRKTKAAPCIYWLPLTAEQIHMKEEQRKQRQVEREKRRQQNDQTDNVKNIGQRSRSIEKEDSRNWRKSKSPAKSRSRRR